MYIGSQKIIEKKREYLVPCSYHFYQYPPQLVTGSMQFLCDDKGKRYLDFYSGVSVMGCGHCNAEILQKTAKQMLTLQHTTSIYLTQPVVDLAERLAGLTPGGLKRFFFTSSGSEANEGALLAASLCTGKTDFIGMRNGLHGRTYLTMGVTGLDMWRTAAVPCPNTHIVTNYFPDEERCLEETEDLLKKGNIAAFIAEPLQGNGGILSPSPDFFKRLSALLKQYGALLIIDEVQTGFGRTGKMFCIEHFGVTPDIMTMAKALGNGVPISCYATTDEIAALFTKASASTFGGNPVACVNAMAVLDYIEKYDLVANSVKLGKKLKEMLTPLLWKGGIKYVRGMGLMVGVEFDSEARLNAVMEGLKNDGVLVGKTGAERNVMALQPPMIINDGDVEDFIEMLINNL